MGFIDDLKRKAATCDTDLALVTALHNLAASRHPLSPTDRHIVRQGLDAAARVGAKLLDRKAVTGAATCAVTPRNTPTARLRRVPRRLRFVFSLDRNGETAPQVFLNLLPQHITIGLNHPAFDSEQARKATMKRFRKHAPDVARALREAQADPQSAPAEAWHLSHAKPTPQPDRIGTDLNDWLAARNKAQSRVAGAFTISKKLPYEALSTDLICDLLAETCTTFAPFLTPHGPDHLPFGRHTVVTREPQSATA